MIPRNVFFVKFSYCVEEGGAGNVRFLNYFTSVWLWHYFTASADTDRNPKCQYVETDPHLPQ